MPELTRCRGGFLLPVKGDARFWKRIEALAELGVTPEILSFEREYYPGREIPYPIEDLGRVLHGRYARRVPTLLRALPTIRRAFRSVDFVYAFGLDMAFLASLATPGNPDAPLVYEVGDIPPASVARSLEGRLLRALERYLLGRVDLLVVTSPSFIDGFYRQRLGLPDLEYITIENKVPAQDMPEPRGPGKVPEARLRIGYFGNLRCQRSWELLKRTVRSSGGRVEVLVRGINRGIRGLEDDRVPGIRREGAYVWPDDLPDMYGSVDVAWLAFWHEGDPEGNWRWARANRFYEACWFRRPMIAQKGTRDGAVVEREKLGLTLDMGDMRGAVEAILDVDADDLKEWGGAIDRLPFEAYAYTDEHERLLRRIDRMVGERSCHRPAE